MGDRNDPRDSRAKLGRCPAINRDGSPCGGTVLPGAAWCVFHDPARAEQRREGARRGGQAKSNAARARKALPAGALTAEEIRAHLGIVFIDVIEGKTEPNVGTAAATIARALLDVAKVAEVEHQVSQLRRDLAAFAERRGEAG